MILFLHIGTEKTASSFLQVILARHRQWLMQQGIYFPRAGKWEKEMRAGHISPGNGETLQKALLLDDETRVKSLLSVYRKGALKVGAEKVLISNELLLNGLTSGISSVDFEKIALSLGYSEVRNLLILRDPVDQALSLYRHRAKSGRYGDIKEWLKKDYKLPDQLRQFLIQNPSNLVIRKYDPSGEIILKRFFQDWLTTPLPRVENINQRVNTSLCLSELRMIAEIRQVRPKWVRPFYQKMVTIPLEDKASEDKLKKKYLQEIQHQVIASNEIWKGYNKLMSIDEQLHTPEQTLEESGEEWYNFSTQQVKAIAEFMSETETFAFKIKLTVNRIRNLLARVKWGIYNRFDIS